MDRFSLTHSNGSFVFEGKSWQILISDKSYKIEEEDIPENVLNKVPGLAYGLDVVLEPIGAPKTAYTKLNSIVKYIIKELNGVGIDDQLGELIIPNNPRAIKLEQPEDKRIDLLTFSWWFDNDFLNSRKDYERLFEFITNNCPEFLPNRYGLYEPPQFKFEEQGIDHFLNFLWDNRNDFIVIYTKKPFYSLSLPSLKESYYNRNGFCPNSIEFQVDVRILEADGWERTLKRLWQNLNKLINPIYSDVCVIENYLDQRRTVGVDNQTGSHQVEIGWKGIPENNGLAAFIGDLYKSELNLNKQEFSVSNWATKELIEIKEIPNDFRQKRIRIKPDNQDFHFNRFETYYAKNYPFDKPGNYQIYEESPAYNNGSNAMAGKTNKETLENKSNFWFKLKSWWS